MATSDADDGLVQPAEEIKVELLNSQECKAAYTKFLRDASTAARDNPRKCTLYITSAPNINESTVDWLAKTIVGVQYAKVVLLFRALCVGSLATQVDPKYKTGYKDYEHKAILIVDAYIRDVHSVENLELWVSGGPSNNFHTKWAAFEIDDMENVEILLTSAVLIEKHFSADPESNIINSVCRCKISRDNFKSGFIGVMREMCKPKLYIHGEEQIDRSYDENFNSISSQCVSSDKVISLIGPNFKAPVIRNKIFSFVDEAVANKACIWIISPFICDDDKSQECKILNEILKKTCAGGIRTTVLYKKGPPKRQLLTSAPNISVVDTKQKFHCKLMVAITGSKIEIIMTSANFNLQHMGATCNNIDWLFRKTITVDEWAQMKKRLGVSN